MSTTPAANTTMSYNAADQTTNITVPGVTNLNMTYAGLGQRERLSAGSVAFLNDKLGIATRTSGGATDNYTRSPDGTILGERVNGSNYYYLVDGLGSVIAVTDQNGNTLKDSGGVNTFTYKYEPYGKPLNNPPGSFPTQQFRFAGYYWGSTYGHYKVGERYYDPTTGRWTQPDPVKNPLDEQGWNDYSYAGDNPVNVTDPSGELPPCVASRASRCRGGPGWCVHHGGCNKRKFDPCKSRGFLIGTSVAGIGLAAAGLLLAPETGGTTIALTSIALIADTGTVGYDCLTSSGSGR